MLLKQKIESCVNQKRGIMAIEIVIGCLIFLIVMCLLLDVTTLVWKFSVVSQVNTYLARTVEVQGGISHTMPTGFPGDANSYETSAEVLDTITKRFKSAGIDTFKITINGAVLTNGTNVVADYLTPITTKIEVDYAWNAISTFIPGKLKNTFRSERSVLSEFKYRYDVWSGE